MNRKITFLLIVFTLFRLCAYSQKVKKINTPNYDYQPLHFGFLLGINKADFFIRPIANLASLDSVYVLESSAQSGFNIGIVSNLRINDYADLRFIPALAFSTRNLEYTIKSSRGVIKKILPIESTFVEFPLDFKLKSARMNNFRAYLVFGAKFSIDIASQKDVNSELSSEDIVKLRKNDFYYAIGIGFDFYQQYFKFSPELKFNFGIKNLLVEDTNVYAKSIDRITSKIIDLSFTFE